MTNLARFSAIDSEPTFTFGFTRGSTGMVTLVLTWALESWTSQAQDLVFLEVSYETCGTALRLWRCRDLCCLRTHAFNYLACNFSIYGQRDLRPCLFDSSLDLSVLGFLDYLLSIFFSSAEVPLLPLQVPY
ncbi:hypothetical protein L6452_14896 [Arctium lappa]|uniref:Uncharacterized protein n=1 Tax=Arctium lappa TaxID=4217 RepID=A0ACB9CM94_ARCLA|nr:hypothetical protein L6452_14896 [Arctium lappa]